VTYTEPLTTLGLALCWIAVCLIPASRGKRLLIAGLAALSLLAWAPFEYLLSRPLEARYPIRPFSAPAGMDAIVVLSSAVSPAQFERPYGLPDRETFERCLYAAWIQRHSHLPVLASGGADRPGRPSYALAMRDLLTSAGVAPEMIWIEDRSRSTHENAQFSARVLRQHGARRIALVVEARSMPRAAGCFVKEGIEVVPAPSRFFYLSRASEDWLPGWLAIRGNEITLHETLGLLWYRLHGWL
jgi:uncharacterized SAM-binding protein YcdF (DUF218 family)